MTVYRTYFTVLVISLACLIAEPAYAGTCSNPAGKEADQFYNGDYHTYEFCNGTVWVAEGAGGTPTQSVPVEKAPAGSGYFVMSSGTYTGGSFGSLPGADAVCLTDLTAHTGWQGYATANSNGQLIASKVHAFMCDASGCTNLMPLTTYYFANAGNAVAGGASFTTDSGGLGPNDNADWAAANYFSGTYMYWTGQTIKSGAQWGGTSLSLGGPGVCGFSWYDNAGTGPTGNSADTDERRWYYQNSQGCSNTYNVICFVNP